MGMGNGIRGGGLHRRQLLRLAGGGLTLAALTAGAVGCRTDDELPDGGGSPGDDDAGGDGEGGGDSGGGKDGKAPEALWSRTTSAKTYGDRDELVAAGGVVIASGAPLAALATATGKEKWSLEDGATPGAPMLIGNGTLYLASAKYDGTVTGYDPATGKETWRSRLGEGYRQPRPVAVDDDQVYVVAEILEDDNSSKTNVIAALNSRTGKLAWKEKRDLGTEQNGVHAYVVGRRLVYTDIKKNLTARDTVTGKQIWTHKTTRTNYDFFTVHDDLVIISQNDRLQAFTVADGKEKWSVKAESYASFRTPVVLDGVLYVADTTRIMQALDPATGKRIWKSEALANADFRTPRNYVKVGGTLYGATDLDKKGGIVAVEAKTGAIRWTFNDKSGDYHAWLVATDGKHVFALHGDKLHALPAA